LFFLLFLGEIAIRLLGIGGLRIRVLLILGLRILILLNWILIWQLSVLLSAVLIRLIHIEQILVFGHKKFLLLSLRIDYKIE